MPDINTLKAKIVQLSFKKATSGLTPAEEQELADLQRELSLAQMGQ